MALSPSLHRRLIGILEEHHPAWTLLFSLWVLTLIFRIRLFYGLLRQGALIGPFGFEKAVWSTLFSIGDCITDSVVIAGFGCLVAIAGYLLSLPAQGRWFRSRLVFLSVSSLCICTLVGLHYAVAYRLIWALETRVGMASFRWALSGFSFRDMVSYAEPIDFLFACLGPFAYALALWGGRSHARRQNTFTLLALLVPVLAAAMSYISLDTRKAEKYARLLEQDPDHFNWLDKDFLALKKHLPNELSTNPLGFTLWDFARLILKKPNHYQALQGLPSPRQLESIPWIDPEFVVPTEANPGPSNTPKSHIPVQRWNVLIFLIESGGTKYMLNSGEDIMPTVRRLANEGIFAVNHYSTGASTIPAVFSLFSGIYPPRDVTIVMHPKLKIPSLYSYLGPDYDHFLMTGNSLQAWFPRSLLVNTGLKDISDFDNIEASAIESMNLQYMRDEQEVQQQVEKRLLAAREPFSATYYVYAPHYPYHDYGPSFRIRPAIDSALNRYINDLNLTDHLIDKTLKALLKDGKLDRTIVVIVGDHGEGFGEMIRDRLHGMQTTNEVQQAPLILWQPKLIPPKRIDLPTSHVDLLPTLMDLMQIEGAEVQGESLLNPHRKQKFVFVQNVLREVSSISRDQKKMVIRFDRNQCEFYDLNLDPKESSPTSCDENSEQFSATIKFFAFQEFLIERLNEDKEKAAH